MSSPAGFGLVGPAVAAMAIVMQMNDDPNARTTTTILMTGLGAVSSLLALFVYWPLFRRAVASGSGS